MIKDLFKGYKWTDPETRNWITSHWVWDWVWDSDAHRWVKDSKEKSLHRKGE